MRAKLFSSMLVFVAILAGCSSAIVVDPTPEPVLDVSYAFPDCDTMENDGSRQCATDRTAPTEALPAVVTGSSLSACMVQDQSKEGTDPNGMRVGFPRSETNWGNGTKKVLIAAFDWPDLSDTADPVELLTKDAEYFKNYVNLYTRGNVSIEYEIYPNRIKLLESYKNFAQSEATANTSQWGDGNVRAIDYFYEQFIQAADDELTFDYDLYFLIPPRFNEVFSEFNLWPPHSKTYETNEQPIVRAFTPGGDYHFRTENKLGFFWSHEIMHYFRLPDLYWHDQNSVKRTENTFSGAFANFDLMDGQYVASLNSYLMWLADWTLPGEQVCLSEENYQDSSYELSAISVNDSSLKSVMLRLSETELLVVESRRATEFDNVGRRAKEGVMVFHVDTTVGNGEGALTIIAPPGRKLISDILPGGANTTMLDAFLYEGNRIEIAGYLIEVNKSKLQSDIVSISKIPGWQPGTATDYVCISRDNRQLDEEGRVDCPITF
ncbi:MAG: hypothetical protein RIS51_495 [Actinomycetota bacterium]